MTLAYLETPYILAMLTTKLMVTTMIPGVRSASVTNVLKMFMNRNHEFQQRLWSIWVDKVVV